MSDEEGEVHVCEVCQEILLGTHDLEEHMEDAHTKKAKNEDNDKNESTNSSDDSGFMEKKRSRSPKEKGEEGRKELKKHRMKQHKHRDRSRTLDKDRSSKKESRKNEHIDDGEDLARVKMKKFLSKHDSWDAEKGTVGVAKKAWASEGVVQEHANLDGPQCPKCDQICKDIANLRNHILSHYYSDFYRVTPDTRPFSCPTCGKENRDRITMIRHFAFSHNMLFELTDVTPEMLNASGRESRGPRQVSSSFRRGDDEKQKKDEDEKFKQRMARSGNDRNSLEMSKSSGKDSREHKKHRSEKHSEGRKHRDEKKHKKERREDDEPREKHSREHKREKHKEHKREKHKEHKRERGERNKKDKVHSGERREDEENTRGRREETVDERRIRKEKKRTDKERKPNNESKGASNLSNEPPRDLAPPRTNQVPKQSASSSGGEQDANNATPKVEASSDEEDFGDLPTPVFAE